MASAAADLSTGASSAPDVSSGTNDVTCEVLVVGAGVSGLTAANELLKRDPAIQLCLVEAKGQWRIVRNCVATSYIASFFLFGRDIWSGLICERRIRAMQSLLRYPIL